MERVYSYNPGARTGPLWYIRLLKGQCRYFKLLSVFQYTGPYFFQVGSVFVVNISKYHDNGSVFSVFPALIDSI